MSHAISRPLIASGDPLRRLNGIHEGLACSLLYRSTSAVREAPAFSDRVRLRPGGHHREESDGNTNSERHRRTWAASSTRSHRCAGDLGRTVQEIGTRLTPAHLMEHAKRSLRESTVETTKAVAQSATDVASDVAARTRDVALDARDRGAGASLRRQRRRRRRRAGLLAGHLGHANRRKRLVPREWDEPFDRSSRRAASSRRAMWSASRTSRLIPIGAAAAAAWLIWRSRA